MIRIIIIVFILINAINIYAQTPSVEDEILNYKNENTEKITNAKALLIDKIMIGDTASAKQIIEYLFGLEQATGQPIFMKIEFQLLLYWLKDYSALAYNISMNQLAPESINKQMQFLERDIFFNRLKQITTDRRQELEAAVKYSGLKDYYIDFNIMYLKYLIKSIEHSDDKQEYYNQLADDFLSKYGEGPNNYFVRNQIRLRYLLSEFWADFDFNVGYKKFTNELFNIYGDNFLFDLGFGLGYQNWIARFCMDASSGTLKKDIPIENMTWEKGSKTYQLCFGGTIGYNVFKNKNFVLTPYFGLGRTTISANKGDIDNNPALINSEIHSMAYSLGMNCDYNIPALKYQKNSSEYNWMLRFKYAFNIYGKFDNFAPKGNSHNISIGIAFTITPIYRE